MARKKANLDQAVRRAAALLEEHFATLSKTDEKRARRELHRLATSGVLAEKLHHLREARPSTRSFARNA